MVRLLSLAAGIMASLAACSAGSSTTGSASSANAGSTAASYARAQPVTPAPGPTTGSLSGALIYPSEFAPAQAIYAVGTNGARFYLVEAITGQSHYTLVGVAPGDYFVFATLRWPPAYTAASASRTTSQTRFGAAYTKSVQCGLAFGCGDHTLVPVHVAAGANTSSIDPTDWYAPIGYAVIPDSGPPMTVISGPKTTFDTSLAAATYLAVESTLGRFVQTANSCPVNVACVWLSGEHRGSASAYFTGSAGSNGDIQTCGFYLLNDGNSWRTLDSRCNAGKTPFPAVGSIGHVVLGMGEQGCVNAHVDPGITARVAACLAAGTEVQIDDGPYYAAATSTPGIDYWWHVAGKGWMVHQYLR